jgi:GMP synthase-like glutamine amidotransferase
MEGSYAGKTSGGRKQSRRPEGTKNWSTGAALPLQAFHIEFCFTIFAIHPEQ